MAKADGWRKRFDDPILLPDSHDRRRPQANLCPLHLRKRTSEPAASTSARGHKLTLANANRPLSCNWELSLGAMATRQFLNFDRASPTRPSMAQPQTEPCCAVGGCAGGVRNGKAAALNC